MSHRPCLLVADDDPGDVFLLRRAFDRASLDCDIIDVYDGEQAVHYLGGTPPYDNRARYPFPSLVVLDVKMPGMNGFDVLAWVRGRPYVEHLPIVVLSGSPLESDANAAIHLGAKSYLVKPADVNQMLCLATELYQRWLAPAGLSPELLSDHRANQQQLSGEAFNQG
jgi:CheY-like chemotaxis protein